MKIGLIIDKFDPITSTILDQVNQYRKKLHLDEVWFFVLDENADCDLSYRNKMVEKTIVPYRKYYLADLNDFNLIEKRIYKQLSLKQNKYYSNADLKGVEKIEIDFSSSKEVKKGNFNSLKNSIRSYIMDNGIYCEMILSSLLPEKRFRHSVSVARLSAKIAESNGLDSKLAYLIGMYHDIAKKVSKEEMEKIINDNDAYESSYSPPVWHQYVGMYLLKHTYKWNSKVGLKAVRHHCLGDDKDPYSIIVYLADKLDPLRDYDSSKEIELACKDLNMAYKVVKSQQEEYLLKEGVI